MANDVGPTICPSNIRVAPANKLFGSNAPLNESGRSNLQTKSSMNINNTIQQQQQYDTHLYVTGMSTTVEAAVKAACRCVRLLNAVIIGSGDNDDAIGEMGAGT
ncbi:hypothetical protein BLA29_000265 [Euroglyphus maynei]|uniref:Uncharacterized protein n=1 Tax=Euroglyphus maynei TaxID=6958 RepID=A0A1Y3BBW2_EURMA|nr:hypothetical protein BLA29_000265 [Euroglyphus maynei]